MLYFDRSYYIRINHSMW